MKKILFLIFLFSIADAGQAERIGHVNTVFQLLGRDDQIVVEVFDDPKVENVSCYVSRAVIGGITGEIGLATDPSFMDVACIKTGPVKILSALNEGPEGEPVFTQAQNWAFKQMIITRMLDKKRKTLTYLVWSTKLLEGSYYNSLTVIPIN